MRRPSSRRPRRPTCTCQSRIDPQYAIHRLVEQIKGRSSRLLRDELRYLRSRLSTLWTNSNLVATVGGAAQEVVKRDVENTGTPFLPHG